MSGTTRGTRVTAVELVDPGEPQSVEITDDYVIIADGTAQVTGGPGLRERHPRHHGEGSSAVTAAPTAWPFDADQNHRWAAQYRIPVVATPYPGWKYEVALVVTGDYDGYGVWPSVEPTEAEAAIIGSYVDYRRSYYREHWQRQMLERPLDVDSGTNTVVLLKRPDGCWCFRRMTWTSGYPLHPPAAHLVPDAPQYLLLVDLLDHINEHASAWPVWKAAHPAVFP